MKSDPSNQRTKPPDRRGMAARLAIVSVDTLRMWECSYRVVGPQVSACRHRRHAGQNIDRPALINALVALGHWIRTIAHLPASKVDEPGDQMERDADAKRRSRPAAAGTSPAVTSRQPDLFVPISEEGAE